MADGSSRSSDIGSLAANCKILVAVADTGKVKSLSKKAKFNAGVCMGYVEELRKEIPKLMRERKIPPICIPREVNNIELARVLIKWADSHEQLLYEDELSGMLNAWYQEFPCNKMANYALNLTAPVGAAG
jgi:hypothetical protein